MNRTVLHAVCLLLGLVSTARGEYKLEVGKMTPIKLRIFNHNADPIQNLRFRLGKVADWLDVAIVGKAEVIDKDKNGKPTTWAIAQVNQGADSPFELTVNVTVSGSRGAPTGEEPKTEDSPGKEGKDDNGQPAGGTGAGAANQGDGGKKGSKEEETPVGQIASINFTVWKEEENPGQEKKATKESGDQLGVPPWRSWQAEYSVEATYKELAKTPTDMEWHLADARRGSTGNQVTITINNKSPFKPLLNVMLVPVAGPGPVTVDAAAAADKIVVRNVQGMQVIDKGTSGEFKVTFSVSKDAKPGDTSTLYLEVRTSTLGTTPNPWDPVVMVSVASRHSGLKGDFEAFLYYNLAPLTKEERDKLKGASDEKSWLPVPKGTKIIVSQVYMMRGEGSAEKPVEQFVGYGNVIDDRGYFICKVFPVAEQLMRFRIVAETIANVIDVKYKDENRDEIESLKVSSSRAAVTPFGKRVFRNISNCFLVEREKEASMLEEKGPGTKKHSEMAAAEKRLFYRQKPNQEHNFVVGRKVLIPYYGYEHDINPNRKKGILINWEGELSTGGYINSFTDVPGGVGGAIERVQSLGMGQSYEEIYANELTIASDSPGLIYHNHNELHHVLSALIRAQDFLSTLDFFTPFRYQERVKVPPSDMVPKEPKAGVEGAPVDLGAGTGQTPSGTGGEGDKTSALEKPPMQTPLLPGVIAYWHKAQKAAGETGYALRDDGTWRLVVQAHAEDPDERDIGLVLRGYGAAIRRKFWAVDEVETDDERRKPNYRYYERTTVKEAWQQGFDIFFAAAVLNGPLVENRVAAEPKDREKRSVGLDEVLATARRAADDEIYQPKYRRVRGADNAVAVAAGLWRAGQVLSTGKLVDEILFRKGGDLFWFLNFVRSENPDLLRDMMALGLCPRVDRWPPTASIKDTVSPDAVKMIWHPNDMVAKTKPKAWLIFASVGDKKPVRLPLKGEKTGKEAIIFDFGEVRDGKEGEAQLSSSLGDGEKCYWTIETTMETSSDGKQEKHAFKWPLQDFVASMSSASVQGGGQDLYANSNSKLSVKGGSTDGRVNFGNRTIHSVLGGRKVLGGAVYTLRIMPAEADKPVPQELSQPAELKLRWLKTEDPGDATPGIYYLNQDTNRWGLVGNKRVGEREVMAMVTKAGSYALMVDHLPPQLEELEDAPDPFPVGLEGVNWNLSTKLSEPATLTVQIEDKDGKVFRTLLKEEQKPVGDLQVTWDGKDAEGKLVPDGTYTYRLVAIDESKRTAKPVTGTVTVISGDMGSAEGEVKLAAESKGRPQVHVAGTALSAECDAEGKFWLLGLTQGAHTFEFSAQGHFEEQLQAELKAKGAEITLPAVSLTNVAIKDLKSSSEVFTPDGDGDRDYLSISFSMTRECPLDVGVYDEDGAQVTMLQAGKAMAKGETVVVWQGTDEDDMPRPSGWYSVRFVAHSRSEGIPQGEVKVLLDRGLVKNATAFPYTFSPNDDGFDDSLEIGYNLENDALVTVRLLNRDSSLLKEVLKDDKQEAGWRIVTWDGKGIDGKTISDGRYAFEIRPKYLTGHESKTVRGEFSSDSVPPAIGRVEPLNGSVIKIGFPAITAKVFSDLSDIDPSQLKVKIDEQTALVDKFDEKAGIFSFTPKTSLGEGLHIAIAYAQDWAGNYAPPQAVSFKVEFGEGDQKFDDRTKPEVLDLQPAKSAVVYTATPLITAKVRDADSGIDQNNVLIHVNGERVSNAVKLFLPGKSGKSWDWYYYEKAIVLFDPLLGEIRYVPIDPMKEGKNHVSLEVMDRAGNKSAKAETVFEVVIDNDPPVISNLQPADRSTLARTEVTVSAKVEDVGKSGIVVETLRLMLDGKEISLGEKDFTLSKDTAELAIPLKSPLARNAQHVVQLTVRDHAGNLSQPAMAAFTIVEDGDPPRIDVISPRDKAVFTAKDDILLAAVLYDVGRSRVDESSVRLTVDGQPAQPDDPKTPETEGYLIVKGLLTWKIGTLAPGKHVVCISAKDRAGNVAQDAVWQCEVK